MCKIEGCKCEKVFAKGYCNRHYNQMRKYGKISDRINRNEHIFRIEGDVAYVDIYNE